MQHHVALGLLHFKHRTDRPAALGHHRIEAPGPIDQTAHGAAPDPLIEQQRAVGGAVGAGDPAQFHRCGAGVIQACDQVVDAAEAGIDQQQHRVIAPPWRGSHQGSPGIGRTIQIRQWLGGDRKGLDAGAGQAQQRHAHGGLLLQLPRRLGRGRADHTAGQAAQPVGGLQALPQQRQQAGQVAGEAGRHKHQAQVGRLTSRSELGADGSGAGLQGCLGGQRGATPGLGGAGAALQPAGQ